MQDSYIISYIINVVKIYSYNIQHIIYELILFVFKITKNHTTGRCRVENIHTVS